MDWRVETAEEKDLAETLGHLTREGYVVHTILRSGVGLADRRRLLVIAYRETVAQSAN